MANRRELDLAAKTERKRIALDELMGTVCVCGAIKRAKNSFCSKCYFSLPKGLRNRLYTRMEDGYAELYQQAKDHLKEAAAGMQQTCA